MLSSLSPLIVEKWPLYLLSLSSCIVTVAAQTAGGAVKSVDMMPLGLRVQNAVAAYLTYIEKFFVPVDLAVFYPIHSFPAYRDFQLFFRTGVCYSLGINRETRSIKTYCPYGNSWQYQVGNTHR